MKPRVHRPAWPVGGPWGWRCDCGQHSYDLTWSRLHALNDARLHFVHCSGTPKET